MSNNYLYILGSGAAKPSLMRYPSSQLLDMRNRQFLIDCGEGCQMRIREMHLHLGRLSHVFISHLHGDHCFGLIGLISTLGMEGRTADLHVHAHPKFRELMVPWLDFYCADMLFRIIFDDVTPNKVETVYEDKAVKVTAFPLCHRIPASGYLFEEKPAERHLRRDVCDAYGIPLSAFHRIKQGDDYELPDGRILPNGQLTTPPTPTQSYAYCSDTKYTETIIPHIKGADLLYHDCTYDDANAQRAETYFHSTARQAATIAAKAGVKRLLIGHFSNRIGDTMGALKEAQEVFPDTIAAEDKTKITI